MGSISETKIEPSNLLTQLKLRCTVDRLKRKCSFGRKYKELSLNPESLGEKVKQPKMVMIYPANIPAYSSDDKTTKENDSKMNLNVICNGEKSKYEGVKF